MPGAGALLVLAVVGANAYVVLSERGDYTAEVADVRPAQGAGRGRRAASRHLLGDDGRGALFLAREAGIDVTGLTADLHSWGFQGNGGAEDPDLELSGW